MEILEKVAFWTYLNEAKLRRQSSK